MRREINNIACIYFQLFRFIIICIFLFLPQSILNLTIIIDLDLDYILVLDLDHMSPSVICIIFILRDKRAHVTRIIRERSIESGRVKLCKRQLSQRLSGTSEFSQ